jgi:hypothetical protein
MAKKKVTAEELLQEFVPWEKAKKSLKMPTDDELRKRGYLTVDEFVDAYADALKEYLYSNWPGTIKEDKLNHPVDLFTNAWIFAEVAGRVSSRFERI